MLTALVTGTFYMGIVPVAKLALSAYTTKC